MNYTIRHFSLALLFALATSAMTVGVVRAQPASEAQTTTDAASPPVNPAAPAGTSAMPVAVPVAPMASPEDSPNSVRLRSLEQRVQALKEKTWRAKARMITLKETTLGGGTGANATIIHENWMGTGFRLTRLVYAIDGTQVFVRSDELGKSLYKEKSIPILDGAIGPGSHTISVVAEYRGHGYGALSYLSKFTFQARGTHTLSIEEGKSARILVRGFERGTANTPMEKRPAIGFKVIGGAGK